MEDKCTEESLESTESQGDDSPAGTGTIGVALSGGGVRAALYSLGVILYLAHSGLNKQLKVLISVSGGSITNAAIAAAGDLSKMSDDDANAVCRRLAFVLARYGSLFTPKRPLRVLVVIGVPTYALLFAAWNISGRWQHSSSDQEMAFVRWLLALIGLFLPAFIGYLIVGKRKEFQRREYARLLGYVGVNEGPHLSTKYKVQFSSFPPSEIAHIICATELTSGQPMYFSRECVYSPIYGFGQPLVSADEAVYASAAFPAVFPPLVLRTAPLQLGGGASNLDRPKELLLADGGVYNNLGDDWFTFNENLRKTRWGVDDRFTFPSSPRHHIIVNSSSPARVAPIPRRWPRRNLMGFIRIIVVLYENTLRPRLERLQEQGLAYRTVIDITRSPLETARAAQDAPGLSDAGKGRALSLVAALSDLSDEYWNELVDDTSLVKTGLSPLGNQRTARLMRHGYLSAMAALSPRFGTFGVEKVPSERFFIELTEGPHAHVDHSSPSSSGFPESK